jgi:hypothetical protein
LKKREVLKLICEKEVNHAWYWRENLEFEIESNKILKNQSIVFHQNGYFWEVGEETWQNWYYYFSPNESDTTMLNLPTFFVFDFQLDWAETFLMAHQASYSNKCFSLANSKNCLKEV